MDMDAHVMTQRANHRLIAKVRYLSTYVPIHLAFFPFLPVSLCVCGCPSLPFSLFLSIYLSIYLLFSSSPLSSP